jgi:hypothetical protein
MTIARQLSPAQDHVSAASGSCCTYYMIFLNFTLSAWCRQKQPTAFGRVTLLRWRPSMHNCWCCMHGNCSAFATIAFCACFYSEIFIHYLVQSKDSWMSSGCRAMSSSPARLHPLHTWTMEQASSYRRSIRPHLQSWMAVRQVQFSTKVNLIDLKY